MLLREVGRGWAVLAAGKPALGATAWRLLGAASGTPGVQPFTPQIRGQRAD